MKCVHCGCTLIEPVNTCPSCGKNPSAPDGFRLDAVSGKYRMLANGVDKRSGTPIKVVTWYDPESGSYSQDIYGADEPFAVDGGETKPEEHAETQVEAQPETKPEEQAETQTETQPETKVEEQAETQTETQPEPQVEEQSETKPEEQVETQTEAQPEPQVEAKPETKPEEHAETQTEAQPEPQVEAQPETKPEEQAETQTETQSETESEPQTESEEIPENTASGESVATTQSEAFVPREPALESYRVEKKSHKGIVAIVILVLLAGLAAAGYFLGYFDMLSERLGEQIEAVTQPPEGAKVPEFLPLEPVEPIEELLDVPSDKKHENINSTKPPASVVNYYPQLANVSAFSSRAMQDENYIYFLPVSDKGGFTEKSDLMRVKIGTSKQEPVENCWPGENSIYSFTLFGENIVICAERPEDGSGYYFFLVHKDGGQPMFFFKNDTPAFLTAFEDKIYMLFAEEKKLGVFNQQSTALYDLQFDESKGNAGLMPYFSIVDGHVYYGCMYGGDNPAVEYFRAGLDDLSPESLLYQETKDGTPVNPVFDSEGNIYCGRIGAEGYSFCVIQNGETHDYYTFDAAGAIAPVVAGVESDGVVALIGDNDLTLYHIPDMSPEQDTVVEGLPYAATKDYLIAKDGLYLNSDLSFTPFDSSD